MSDAWFIVEKNDEKIFSRDEVKVSFRKDPQVARVWSMSHAQLADLQSVIDAYPGMS